MKKITMSPNQDETRFGGRVGPYQGWQLSPVWGAFRVGTNKLPWTLYHLPTRRWVTSFPRRDHVVWLSEALDHIGEWTDSAEGCDVDQVLAAFRTTRQRVAIDMAERALVSAQKKAEKDGH